MERLKRSEKPLRFGRPGLIKKSFHLIVALRQNVVELASRLSIEGLGNPFVSDYRIHA